MNNTAYAWFLLLLANTITRSTYFSGRGFADAYVTPYYYPTSTTTINPRNRISSSPTSQLFQSVSSTTVDQALQSRYACTRFQRFDGVNTTCTTASTTSNSTVVQGARKALEMARRAPSGFNVQPYKLLIVSDPVQKEALAQYCIGHNAHRVRDSDCTVLFLADRQSVRTLPNYRKDLLFRTKSTQQRWKKNKFALLKIQVLVGMFSQGLPFPTCISGPISWAFRVGMRVVSWITRRRFVLPTLTSAETWSQKNTMLVAMAYLLGCTSRGIATCPMEGYLTWGIRQSLNIPRRYTIPLIVATGTPFRRPTRSSDDAGMTHGSTPETSTFRYPEEQMVFENTFGNPATSSVGTQ